MKRIVIYWSDCELGCASLGGYWFAKEIFDELPESFTFIPPPEGVCFNPDGRTIEPVEMTATGTTRESGGLIWHEYSKTDEENYAVVRIAVR